MVCGTHATLLSAVVVTVLALRDQRDVTNAPGDQTGRLMSGRRLRRCYAATLRAAIPSIRRLTPVVSRLRPSIVPITHPVIAGQCIAISVPSRAVTKAF